jgi:multidrug efflux pump subunit AcrA (membrane-fusion protein)
MHIALKDTNVALEPGELATVLITLEQKDAALWLPPAAIRTFQGRDVVVIQDGSAQRRVDVKLGIKGEDRVEVLEGVQEGQVVVGQ